MVGIIREPARRRGPYDRRHGAPVARPVVSTLAGAAHGTGATSGATGALARRRGGAASSRPRAADRRVAAGPVRRDDGRRARPGRRSGARARRVRGSGRAAGRAPRQGGAHPVPGGGHAGAGGPYRHAPPATAVCDAAPSHPRDGGRPRAPEPGDGRPERPGPGGVATNRARAAVDSVATGRGSAGRRSSRPMCGSRTSCCSRARSTWNAPCPERAVRLSSGRERRGEGRAFPAHRDVPPGERARTARRWPGSATSRPTRAATSSSWRAPRPTPS